LKQYKIIVNGDRGLSGIDAVKRIVETEGQARKSVDDAKAQAEQVIAKAHEEAEMLRQEAISSAQKQREETLRQAREKAEAEARQSDVETRQLLANYAKLGEARKGDAVNKAVELILSA
jgi:vacuolar-type H+-ATPase subunit H